MVFSNLMGLMDCAILCRTSDRSPKKVKFHRIFRGKFTYKSANFTAIFGANFAENQLVKKANFVVIFRENFVTD